MNLIVPKNYKPSLDILQTQEAIKTIRDSFQYKMEVELGLKRVSAPRFVLKSSGLNDNLSGTEKPVSFNMHAIPKETIEIVHSLAKWKRMALKKYNFKAGDGLYTNMDAIRKDEDVDNLHSIYVDQWDWERIITRQTRNFDTLESQVIAIFNTIKHLELEIKSKIGDACADLPNEIKFINTQELLDEYPTLSSKERENEICKKYGCVFLAQIGTKLSNGQVHDMRAPDYDDWTLNGDILFWYEPLSCALEISSMGIRVDARSLKNQLEVSGNQNRENLPYHQAVLNDELPLTMGGGIGQSRLCMLLLNKAHIGEVQASIWPEDMIQECKSNNINLL